MRDKRKAEVDYGCRDDEVSKIESFTAHCKFSIEVAKYKRNSIAHWIDFKRSQGFIDKCFSLLGLSGLNGTTKTMLKLCYRHHRNAHFFVWIERSNNICYGSSLPLSKN